MTGIRSGCVRTQRRLREEKRTSEIQVKTVCILLSLVLATIQQSGTVNFSLVIHSFPNNGKTRGAIG